MLRIKFSSIAILVLVVIASSCNNKEGVRKIHLTHSGTTDHPVHKGMVRFTELLAKKSNSRINAKVYHGNQLGSDRECVELLQIGSLAITKVPTAVLENFHPNFKVLSLPYIFRSDEHKRKTLSGPIGRELLKGLESYGMVGLCYYESGNRSFYSKSKLINTPNDIKGLKVRVMNSQSSIKMVSAFDGMATPISFGELYAALQQGVVDIAENNIPSYVSNKHYEICKFYSFNEHLAIPDVLVMSKIIWESFNKEEQKWILEAAQESTVYQEEQWDISIKESIKMLEKEGVKIAYPDKKTFIERTQKLRDEFNEDVNLARLIKEIETVR